MKSPIAITLVVAISLGLAGPGHAEDGGLTKRCRAIKDGEAERMAARITNLSREELVRLTREAATTAGIKFTGLSETEKDRLSKEWREVMIKSPAVLMSFCDYFARGALPEVGPDVGHGSVMLNRDILTISADGDTGKEPDPEPGENDCEKPYPITLEREGRGMRYNFCETGAKFTLTSSYRADGDGGWTKIE